MRTSLLVSYNISEYLPLCIRQLSIFGIAWLWDRFNRRKSQGILRGSLRRHGRHKESPFRLLYRSWVWSLPTKYISQHLVSSVGCVLWGVWALYPMGRGVIQCPGYSYGICCGVPCEKVDGGASGISMSRGDGEASEDKSFLKPSPVWESRSTA